MSSLNHSRLTWLKMSVIIFRRYEPAIDSGEILDPSVRMKVYSAV